MNKILEIYSIKNEFEHITDTNAGWTMLEEQWINFLGYLEIIACFLNPVIPKEFFDMHLNYY